MDWLLKKKIAEAENNQRIHKKTFDHFALTIY